MKVGVNMEKKVLIIQTGSSYQELVDQNMNFDNMIIRRIKTKNYKVLKVFQGDPLPEYKEIDRIIITGAHSMVTDNEEWIDDLSTWLLGLKEENSIPVLGICYGHQLLAQTFNGVIDYHPRGPEIGMVKIKLTKDGQKDELFQGINTPFNGYVTHSQSVIKLPEEACLLAYNSFEPHHSFRIGKSIYGVQFHPEFTADIMKVYVRNQREKVGHTFDDVYNKIKELDSGIKLIENFICL